MILDFLHIYNGGKLCTGDVVWSTVASFPRECLGVLQNNAVV